MIHEVVFRWEQGEGVDERRRKKGQRPQADVVVTQMERVCFGLSCGPMVIEKDGVVVRQWDKDGKPVSP